MTLHVLVTAHAERDFAEQFAHIGLESPDSAERFRLRLLETLQFLAQSPRAGRPYPPPSPALRGMRVWRVAGFSKILVFYQVERDRIIIRRILHGAMNLNDELTGD